MLESFVRTLVRWGRSAPALTVCLALLLTALSGWYAARTLTVTTDTAELFDPALPFRQADAAYYRLFPGENTAIVAVLDRATQADASAAAAALAQRLRQHPQLILSVSEPGSGPFFDRHGLLYLGTAELERLAADLAAAQPSLAVMRADPTTRGVLTLLDQSLDGLAAEPDRAGDIARSADQVAAALASGQPLDWNSLAPNAAGGAPGRALLIIQPRLDFTQVGAGTAATDLIRREAAALFGPADSGPPPVRLTGPTPMEDEEFQTIEEGTTLSGIVSVVLVLAILILAVRKLRFVGAILLVLGLGLVITGGWAALAVGRLNLISIAFAVMFVGIAVDFGIQLCLRYRDERVAAPDAGEALDRAARKIARAEAISAATIAVGFFAFLPTDYKGVAELGIIAGGGMIIALLLTITVLPALIVLLKAPGEREPPGFAWAAGPNRWLLQHRRRVLLATGVVMLAGLAVLPSLRIDFDPLKLRNPATESMATLRDLMGDPWATPNTLSVLAPSLEAAQAQAARLKRLPEVREALTVASLIPDDQDTKLAILADLAFLFDPALVVPAGPQEAAAVAAQARALAQRLRALETSSPLTAPRQSGDARPPIASHLANQLDRLAKQLAGPQGAKALVIADQQLAGGAKTLIRRLDTSLSAEPVTLDTLPADLKAGWIATDGRYRVQIYPRAGLDDPDGLATFTRAVTAQAPTAIGPPVLILETGRVVIGAFLQAAGLALVGVVLLLWIAHRNLPDVLRTLAPLLVATVLTLATLALIDLPITFANVIGLPLLLGIGVSYPIYLVALWRSGDDRLLPSAVARAVLFSGFTTMAAFGSLALSDHPGTAGLGVLLALALTYTLLATLVVLPALLGPRDRRP